MLLLPPQHPDASVMRYRKPWCVGRAPEALGNVEGKREKGHTKKRHGKRNGFVVCGGERWVGWGGLKSVGQPVATVVRLSLSLRNGSRADDWQSAALYEVGAEGAGWHSASEMSAFSRVAVIAIKEPYSFTSLFFLFYS